MKKGYKQNKTMTGSTPPPPPTAYKIKRWKRYIDNAECT